MEVVIGIGLVVLWAVSSLLLELGWVGVVLLGALLLAAFHTLVQRRPWRALLLRDTASFAHGWAGKLLVAAVLVAVPVAMVLTSVGGGRYGRYADDSWQALLMVGILAGELRRLTSPCPDRGHRRGDRRGCVLGVVPGAGGRPHRRPDGPGPSRRAGAEGLAGRQPRRRRRRDRPGRGPAGAAGRDRRRRHDPDGGRVDDQGDDRPGHRRRRGSRRGPHGCPGRHLPSAAGGLTGRHRHAAGARHPHRRVRRVRCRHRPPRRLDGAARQELLHRRQRPDDRGNQEPDAAAAAAATPTPRSGRPWPARPSPRQPT